MFPFDIEDDIQEELPEDKIPTDYEIDFATGKLTGKMVTGLEAIKQWIYAVLSTDRYFYTQYSWNHGCELNSLIGKGYSDSYIQSEAKRMIEDALLVNDDITSIEDIEITIDDSKIIAEFKVNTTYGGETINV